MSLFSCPNCGAPREGRKCLYCRSVFNDLVAKEPLLIKEESKVQYVFGSHWATASAFAAQISAPIIREEFERIYKGHPYEC